MISTSLQTSHQPLPCKGGMGPGLISILFSVSCWQISPSRASAEQGRCRRKGTDRQWDYPPDAECPRVPMRLCSAQTWPGAPLLLPLPGIGPPFLAQPAQHSSRTPRPFPSLAPSPSRTGCPEPGLEQKMVYFRMMPLGLAGGSQDTTTLLAEDGTALMPAGGPGTEGGGAWQSRARRSPGQQHPTAAGIPSAHRGDAAVVFPHQHWADASGDGSAGALTPLPTGHLSTGGSSPLPPRRQAD